MQVRIRHVVWQDCCYHFRYVVPSDIRGYVGRREFKRSLHTTLPLEAQAAARHLAGMVERHLSLIRKAVGSTMDVQRKKDFIQRFVLTKLEADLHWHEDFRTQRDTITPRQAELELAQTEAWLAKLRQELACNDLLPLQSRVQAFAREHFPKEANEFLSDPAVLKELTREVQKARVVMAETEVERCKGRYNNPVDDVKGKLIEALGRTQAAAAPQAGTAVHTLKQMADQYTKENVSGGNWSPKTAATVQSLFEDLFEVLGRGTDITTITRAHLTDFRGKLMRLPPNREKVARYKGKTIAQILKMPSVTPMSHSTLRKRMVWTTSFFKWCSRNDYIAKNPSEGLVPAASKRPPSKERDPYSPADLQKLVSALAAHRAEAPDRPEQFWIPLVALYSGMRLNEICQLYCDDVKQVEDVWCFDINQNTQDKMLKSAAAARTVPVHPKLIELGFLDHVKAMQAKGEKRVWPNLKHRRDGYGQDFSRWFGRFSDKDVVNDPKKVFHSFRHNFTDTLKQKGVQEVAIAELVGHENPSITTSRYGKPLKAGPLLEVLEKLDYGLDLSPLKAPQGSAAAGPASS